MGSLTVTLFFGLNNKYCSFIYYIYMKHLFPTSDEQTIKIIPRVYTTSIILKLRDDSSNEIVSITPTSSIVKGYLEITSVFDFKDGRFYYIKVIDTTNDQIIYREKIFCTAQLTNQANNEYYSVNKDEYKPKSGNNDFIILWVNV